MRQFSLPFDADAPRAAAPDAADADAILAGLNPVQQEAARATEGPI